MKGWLQKTWKEQSIQSHGLNSTCDRGDHGSLAHETRAQRGGKVPSCTPWVSQGTPANLGIFSVREEVGSTEGSPCPLIPLSGSPGPKDPFSLPKTSARQMSMGEHSLLVHSRVEIRNVTLRQMGEMAICIFKVINWSWSISQMRKGKPEWTRGKKYENVNVIYVQEFILNSMFSENQRSLSSSCTNFPRVSGSTLPRAAHSKSLLSPFRFSYVKSMICDSQQWNTNGCSKNTNCPFFFLITKCNNSFMKTLTMMSFLKCQTSYWKHCHKIDRLFGLQIAAQKGFLNLCRISGNAYFSHLILEATAPLITLSRLHNFVK